MPSLSAALLDLVGTKDTNGGGSSSDQPTSQCRFMFWKRSWRESLNLFIEQFYPHHLKMMMLFVIAALHLAYACEFLSAFRSYESLANEVEFRASSDVENRDDINLVRLVMMTFIDYKKNLWMTVSAMCASLSTSAIIVLFYNTYWPNMNRLTKTVVSMVDTVAFLSLPFLLGARMMIALNLTTYIQPSLRAASRLVPTNGLMDELKCSIVPMESLPLCSVIVERSIFPVVVLKFLIVLCVLTAAYILLAYLIEYCIRHWFPPSDQDEVAKRVLVETA